MSDIAGMFYQLLARPLAGSLLGIAAAVHLTSPTTAKSEPQEIAIGLMSEMSGAFVENGENCQRGYMAARSAYAPKDRVGGRSVRFVYADSQGDAKVGVSEFRRLTETEHIAVVLTTRSQIGMALNPLSKQAKLSLIGTVGHSDFVRDNPYSFRFYPSVDAEADALVSKAIEMGYRKFAMISGEDQWLLSLSEAFTSKLRDKGGEVVGNETILNTEADLGSLVSRLRQRDPQAFFVNLGISQSGIVLKRLYELAPGKQIFTTFWGASQEARDAAGKEAVEGMVFVEADLRQPGFLGELKKNYGEERASAVTFSCYAELSTVLQVLRQDEEIRDPQTLYAALLRINEVKLLDGPLPIVNREARFPLGCKVVRNGHLVDLP